jgi:hypothetical protein
MRYFSRHHILITIMKTRAAFPLLYAMSFLMVSATSGSAQVTPLTPCDPGISLQSGTITHDLSRQGATPHVVYGSIDYYIGGPCGAMTVNIGIRTPTNWITETKVGGYVVKSGDAIELTTSQTPIEVTATPNTTKNGIDSFCIYIYQGTNGLGYPVCLTLVTTDQSDVSADPPLPNIILEPNPAGTYIYVRGLSNAPGGFQYEIYSMDGAEVRHGMLPADARINVQDLNSGAYRFLLFDGKRTLANTAITILH